MRELHLFAGAGGGILGGILLGHTCVCAVEIEPYCRQVLLQRQRDGCLPKFPIWDDVRTFDGRPWRGVVENSSDLAIRGLNRVLADLAALGMDAIWGVFSACATGAPHMRFRLFVLAYPKSGRARQLRRIKCPQESASKRNIHWTLSESGIARKVDGVAGVVDRLKATGNGQVPAVVRLAWETLVNL
jgi:DNA (cytosine-5)-methyltransferase 1